MTASLGKISRDGRCPTRSGGWLLRGMKVRKAGKKSLLLPWGGPTVTPEDTSQARALAEGDEALPRAPCIASCTRPGAQ